MASVLIVKDKKIFTNLLSGISFKNSATFEITPDYFKISTLQAPFFYLVLDNSLFSIDQPISFTIRVDELKKSFNLLSSNVAYLEKSFKIIEFEGMECLASCEAINTAFTKILNDSTTSASVEQIKKLPKSGNNSDVSILNSKFLQTNFQNIEIDYNFVDIPFVNPINTYYIEKTYYPVRFFIEKECLRNFIHGDVRYTCDGKKISLISQMPEIFERLEIEAEFFNVSHLDFRCSNDWVTSILEFYSEIDKVFFCFSDTLLSIKFLFTKYPKSYLEIQVREKIKLNS